MAKPGSIPIAFTGSASPDAKKATHERFFLKQGGFQSGKNKLFMH